MESGVALLLRGRLTADAESIPTVAILAISALNADSRRCAAGLSPLTLHFNAVDKAFNKSPMEMRSGQRVEFRMLSTEIGKELSTHLNKPASLCMQFLIAIGDSAICEAKVKSLKRMDWGICKV